jgi:hypothetical protein
MAVGERGEGGYQREGRENGDDPTAPVPATGTSANATIMDGNLRHAVVA